MLNLESENAKLKSIVEWYQVNYALLYDLHKQISEVLGSATHIPHPASVTRIPIESEHNRHLLEQIAGLTKEYNINVPF